MYKHFVPMVTIVLREPHTVLFSSMINAESSVQNSKKYTFYMALSLTKKFEMDIDQ